MQTYIDRVRMGHTTLNDDTLDDFIEEWHTSDSWRNYELHAAIGVSQTQYEKILKKGLLNTVLDALSTN